MVDPALEGILLFVCFFDPKMKNCEDSIQAWNIGSASGALTIIYGPHVACSSARLLPAKPGGLCEGSVWKRNRNSGPSEGIKYSMLIQPKTIQCDTHLWK